MSASRGPLGPQPGRVYWRHRIIVGLGVLAVIAVILLIVLVVFGPKRLPGLGKQLGTGMREFKDSISGKGGSDDEPEPKQVAAAPAEPLTGEARPQDQPVTRREP